MSSWFKSQRYEGAGPFNKFLARLSIREKLFGILGTVPLSLLLPYRRSIRYIRPESTLAAKLGLSSLYEPVIEEGIGPPGEFWLRLWVIKYTNFIRISLLKLFSWSFHQISELNCLGNPPCNRVLASSWSVEPEKFTILKVFLYAGHLRLAQPIQLRTNLPFWYIFRQTKDLQILKARKLTKKNVQPIRAEVEGLQLGKPTVVRVSVCSLPICSLKPFVDSKLLLLTS